MAGTERPRVGVSSCLLGALVRFNGGHKRSRFLTDELDRYVDWVPYCPEIEIGLGTPREPIRLTVDHRLVNRSGSADHTVSMNALLGGEIGKLGGHQASHQAFVDIGFPVVHPHPGICGHDPILRLIRMWRRVTW